MFSWSKKFEKTFEILDKKLKIRIKFQVDGDIICEGQKFLKSLSRNFKNSNF